MISRCALARSVWGAAVAMSGESAMAPTSAELLRCERLQACCHGCASVKWPAGASRSFPPLSHRSGSGGGNWLAGVGRMAIGLIFQAQGVTWAQYEQVRDEVVSGNTPAPGMLYHAGGPT